MTYPDLQAQPETKALLETCSYREGQVCSLREDTCPCFKGQGCTEFAPWELAQAHPVVK